MKVEKLFWLLGLSWFVWNSLSLSLFPFPPFPYFRLLYIFTRTISHFSLHVIISQWLACFQNKRLFVSIPFPHMFPFAVDVFLSRSTQSPTALLLERLGCYSITSVWNSLHLRSVLHYVLWSAKDLVNIQQHSY